MPDFLESKLRSEYGDNDSAVYGTMNNIGAMHGNKITAKGRAMERKHDSKIPKRLAAGGVVGIPSWQSLDEPDPEISPLERAALLAKQQQEQQQAQQPGLAPTPQPPQPPPDPQSAPDPSSQPQAEPALDQTDDSVTNDSPGASSTMAPSIIPPAKPVPAPAPVDNRQEEASALSDQNPPSSMPSSIPGHQDGQPGSIPPRSIPSPVGSIGSGPAQHLSNLATEQLGRDTFKTGPDGQLTSTPKGIPVWRQAISAVIPRAAPYLMHPQNKLDQNLESIRAQAKTEKDLQQAVSTEEQKRTQTEAYKEWHMLTAEQRANLKVPKPGMRELLQEAMAAKGRDGQPLYGDDDLRVIANGGKVTAEKTPKFSAVDPNHSILNTSTGEETPGIGGPPTVKPTGDFEKVFLPAYAAKLGKTVTTLSPDETMKAFGVFKETNADPEMRASMLASRALADSVRALALKDEPTTEQAAMVAQDLMNHRMAPEQLSSIFGGFGKAGQIFKRMVYAEGKKIDPNFNYEEASAEYGLVKSPSFQTNIRFMDSVRQSIPQVIQAAQVLANGKLKVANTIRNIGKSQFNNVDLGKFNTDRLLVADEIGKLLAGGGTGSQTSDSKLNQAMAIIKETDDPALVMSNLDEVNKLLGYRRGALTKGTYLERPEDSHPSTGGVSVGGGSTTTSNKREQHSASTGAYRYTLDGGKTWQAGRLPKQ